MLCPTCQTEMHLGYLDFRIRGIQNEFNWYLDSPNQIQGLKARKWAPNIQFFCIAKKNNILQENISLYAWSCLTCKTVVIPPSSNQ